MSDLLRTIGASLFGWRYVWLTDCWGSRYVRRVRFFGGRPHAAKYEISDGYAELLDEGGTSGVSYIRSWEPYEIGGEPRWPVYTNGIAKGIRS